MAYLYQKDETIWIDHHSGISIEVKILNKPFKGGKYEPPSWWDYEIMRVLYNGNDVSGLFGYFRWDEPQLESIVDEYLETYGYSI